MGTAHVYVDRLQYYKLEHRILGGGQYLALSLDCTIKMKYVAYVHVFVRILSLEWLPCPHCCIAQ